MVASLNHQDQEQIDHIKQLWASYGGWVSGVLLAIALAFAGYQGWRWWLSEQSIQAANLYAEFSRAEKSLNASQMILAYNDLRLRYPKTIFLQQAALAMASTQQTKGQSQSAITILTWLAQSDSEAEYRSIAALRLAGILMTDKRYEEAIVRLQESRGNGFDALIDDRLGDIYMLQKKSSDASAAYQSAWKGLEDNIAYRRLIEAKLMTLGVDPHESSKLVGKL
jgi:predicted negative regulator of RcsB-dependent stress response